MIVLDTTFLIDFLKGKKETLKIIDLKEPLLTTQINMYEVIRGLFIKNLSQTKFLEISDLFETIKVIPLDDRGIIKSAEISAQLIKSGSIISDCPVIVS